MLDNKAADDYFLLSVDRLVCKMSSNVKGEFSQRLLLSNRLTKTQSLFIYC